MKKYTSFILFLLDTPKNLASIIITWIMCLVGIVVCNQTREDFDPGFFEGTITFLVLIMILIWYRAYTIYKANS